MKTKQSKKKIETIIQQWFFIVLSTIAFLVLAVIIAKKNKVEIKNIEVLTGDVNKATIFFFPNEEEQNGKIRKDILRWIDLKNPSRLLNTDFDKTTMSSFARNATIVYPIQTLPLSEFSHFAVENINYELEYQISNKDHTLETISSLITLNPNNQINDSQNQAEHQEELKWTSLDGKEIKILTPLNKKEVQETFDRNNQFPTAPTIIIVESSNRGIRCFIKPNQGCGNKELDKLALFNIRKNLSTINGIENPSETFFDNLKTNNFISDSENEIEVSIDLRLFLQEINQKKEK